MEDRLLELRGREPAAVNSGADEQPAGASGPPVSHLVPSRLHGLQLPAVQALGLSATRCQPAASGHDLWCLALLPTRKKFKLQQIRDSCLGAAGIGRAGRSQASADLQAQEPGAAPGTLAEDGPPRTASVPAPGMPTAAAAAAAAGPLKAASAPPAVIELLCLGDRDASGEGAGPSERAADPGAEEPGNGVPGGWAASLAKHAVSAGAQPQRRDVLALGEAAEPLGGAWQPASGGTTVRADAGGAARGADRSAGGGALGPEANKAPPAPAAAPGPAGGAEGAHGRSQAAEDGEPAARAPEPEAEAAALDR